MYADLALVGARAAHLLAAAAWVGGGIAYAVSGGPAPRSGNRPFWWLVRVCAWVLILSGAVLTVDRLTGAQAGPLYVALLGVKLGLGLAMFVLAGTLAPPVVARRGPAAPGGRPSLRRPYLVLALGVAVYLLGATLAVLYTRGLAAS